MATLRKPSAYLCITLACLVLLAGFAMQATSNHLSGAQKQAASQGSIQEILLQASQADGFHIYNTNGTPPHLSGNSVLFCGSSKTNMYMDIVSLSSINAQKSLVLEAQVSVNMTSLSNTGEDQFAVFATDDTTNYKSDEFGFVLPEMGNAWYAYVQSPQINGFFVWKPILNVGLNQSQPHNFKAVYSDDGSVSLVDFYVDGKLVWSTPYPNVSGNGFHMVATSHKVSAEGIDVSQNQMVVANAVLNDRVENGAPVTLY